MTTVFVEQPLAKQFGLQTVKSLLFNKVEKFHKVTQFLLAFNVYSFSMTLYIFSDVCL